MIKSTSKNTQKSYKNFECIFECFNNVIQLSINFFRLQRLENFFNSNYGFFFAFFFKKESFLLSCFFVFECNNFFFFFKEIIAKKIMLRSALRVIRHTFLNNLHVLEDLVLLSKLSRSSSWFLWRMSSMNSISF